MCDLKMPRYKDSSCLLGGVLEEQMGGRSVGLIDDWEKHTSAVSA